MADNRITSNAVPIQTVPTAQNQPVPQAQANPPPAPDILNAPGAPIGAMAPGAPAGAIVPGAPVPAPQPQPTAYVSNAGVSTRATLVEDIGNHQLQPGARLATDGEARFFRMMADYDSDAEGPVPSVLDGLDGAEASDDEPALLLAADYDSDGDFESQEIDRLIGLDPQEDNGAVLVDGDLSSEDEGPGQPDDDAVDQGAPQQGANQRDDGRNREPAEQP